MKKKMEDMRTDMRRLGSQLKEQISRESKKTRELVSKTRGHQNSPSRLAGTSSRETATSGKQRKPLTERTHLGNIQDYFEVKVADGAQRHVSR